MELRLLMVVAFALSSLTSWAAVVPEGQAPVPPVPLPAVKPESSRPPPAIVGSRGRMLYENHCTRCHTSVVHVREQRRAVSLKALEGWVRRWSGEEKLGWSEEEIIEVVDHLNRRFYRFPKP